MIWEMWKEAEASCVLYIKRECRICLGTERDEDGGEEVISWWNKTPLYILKLIMLAISSMLYLKLAISVSSYS